MPDFDYEEDDHEAEIEAADPKALPEGGITFTAGPNVMRAIENEIVANVCNTLERRVIIAIEKRLKELVDQTVANTIGERAVELVQQHLDKPRRKTDMWGNPTGPETSFAELIPGMVEHYLNQTVDSSGRVSTYSGDSKTTRAAWIISAHVKAHIDPVISKTVTDISNLAKTTIAGKVGQFIAAELTPQIDAKAIEAKVKANG